jgi:hypothetical protein
MDQLANPGSALVVIVGRIAGIAFGSLVDAIAWRQSINAEL